MAIESLGYLLFGIVFAVFAAVGQRRIVILRQTTRDGTGDAG